MGLGRVYKCYVLRGIRLRAGSRRLGFMPKIKKAKKVWFASVYGRFPNGFGF
jgi:hypothetical protein